MSQVFLLSPANAGGERARMLRNPRASFETARRLQEGSAEVGEVFAFISGLYFRGKLAYARRFAAPPEGAPGVLVITAGLGLAMPESQIGSADLEQIASVPIDAGDARYRLPLERDARNLALTIQPSTKVVLLGSVATVKYLEPLLAIFGERLFFPEAFVGRGDMSRGGLMLRCASGGEELNYVPVLGAKLHGARPPKLPKLPRAADK